MLKDFKDKIIPMTILRGNETVEKEGQESFTVYSLSYMDKFSNLKKIMIWTGRVYNQRHLVYMKEEEIDQFEKLLSECHDSCVAFEGLLNTFRERRMADDHKASLKKDRIDSFMLRVATNDMYKEGGYKSDLAKYKESIREQLEDLYDAWVEKCGTEWNPFDPPYEESTEG